MRIFLIGHRGVGKSVVLNGLRSHPQLTAWSFLDLDQQIETELNMSISEVFKQYGELAFRKIEIDTFRRGVAKLSSPCAVALGAGFDLSVVDREPGDLFVWLQRDTDRRGRIFFDRPRLNPDQDPLAEFLDRKLHRDFLFEKYADLRWLLPEGRSAEPTELIDFLLGQLSLENAFLTLNLPIKRLKSVMPLLNRVNGELRSDIYSVDEMEEILSLDLFQNAMLSKRTLDFDASELFQKFEKKIQFRDWPLEHGDPEQNSVSPDFWNSVSVHSYKGGQQFKDILEEMESFNRPGRVLKVSVTIDNLQDLMLGHKWFSQDPKFRAFLPTSRDGRFRWYRAFFSRSMPYTFLRAFESKIVDQPSLGDWMRMRGLSKMDFAAVLGDPVDHSMSPAEHFSFFKKQFGIPYLAIKASSEEAIDQGFLKELIEVYGLKAASVTSPLKKSVLKLGGNQTSLVKELKSANTLFVNKRNELWFENTDERGFSELIQKFEGLKESEKVVVYGGGGVLEVIKKLLPKAQLYASQTGKPRSGQSEVPDVSTLIWAAGDFPLKRFDKLPFIGWRPQRVIDLSYAEDSPVRHYAIQCGAEYVSGLAMFLAQASAQQSFWRYQAGGEG